MAIYKNKKSKLPFIEEIERLRSKHTKNPTVCSDQRRQYGHCGICGYGDLAIQGVDHCTECGKEKEVLLLEDGRWWRDHDIMECHFKTSSFRGKEYETSSVKRTSILVCLACGAIRGPSCPNCKRVVWRKGLKKYCGSCGYTV